MTNILKVIALSQMMLFASLSCSEKAKPIKITLNIKVVAGTTPVEIGGSGYLDEEGTSYGVTKFQALLSDVRLARGTTSSSQNIQLLHSGGSSSTEPHSLADYHFFDLSDTSTHTIQATHYIDNFNYNSVNFTFGLVADKNYTSSLPNETVYNNFAWPNPLGGGYHYMKFEGSYISGGSQAFVVHSGPTGGTDYSIPVSVPATLKLDGENLTVNVTINLNGWFSNPNDFSFDVIPSMIMMNTTAQQTIKENGAAGVFSAVGVTQ